MFFYISFLRPPPLRAAPFGTIPITPQIANDLRTENFHGSQDIFYAWALEAESSLSKLKNHETITKPIKLTTWREANAYKEIPVPVPPGVSPGQSWRLLLSAVPSVNSASGSVVTIDLNNIALGSLPFPVLSMPIVFAQGVGKGGGGGKQEQVERVYQLLPAVDDVPAVVLKITEQTSFDLDKVCLQILINDTWFDWGVRSRKYGIVGWG